jgi:hypothetical protein
MGASNTNSIWLRRVWRHPWINLGQAVQYTTPSGKIGITSKMSRKGLNQIVTRQPGPNTNSLRLRRICRRP